MHDVRPAGITDKFFLAVAGCQSFCSTTQTSASLLLQDANFFVQLHRQDDAWYLQSHHSWHSEHQPSRQAMSQHWLTPLHACWFHSVCLHVQTRACNVSARSTCRLACHILDVALYHEDTSYRVMGVATETSPALIWLTGWTSISHTSITRYPAQVKVELFEKCRPVVDRCTASSTQLSYHHYLPVA